MNCYTRSICSYLNNVSNEKIAAEIAANFLCSHVCTHPKKPKTHSFMLDPVMKIPIFSFTVIFKTQYL